MMARMESRVRLGPQGTLDIQGRWDYPAPTANLDPRAQQGNRDLRGCQEKKATEVCLVPLAPMVPRGLRDSQDHKDYQG